MSEAGGSSAQQFGFSLFSSNRFHSQRAYVSTRSSIDPSHASTCGLASLRASALLFLSALLRRASAAALRHAVLHEIIAEAWLQSCDYAMLNLNSR